MNRNLELLYEVGAFRWVRRTWEQFFNTETATNTDHSFRVMWTALILTRMEEARGAKVDELKILKMAMLHDIPESRVGDTNYLSRQYIKQDEAQAMNDIFKDTSVKKELMTLWKEYMKRKTLEARIVKDADVLDVDLELSEMAVIGNDIRKHFNPHRKVVSTMLFTESAKELWKQIQSANPYDWHLKGRNRFNAGDWTKQRKKLGKKKY